MKGKEPLDAVDDLDATQAALVQLARLALAGREQDTALFVQRTARRFRDSEPALANALVGMLREAPTRSSPLRRGRSGGPTEIPVDTDSRLALVRVEDVPMLESTPILTESVAGALQQIIDERARGEELSQAGLSPTRTALLLGPPGVGKTMAARWVAVSLGLPLLVLDLSAVMSSLLGRTGINLRHVLDYAKAQRCVLLIDELDSIGKRRDDDSDVGELKRLVNVLLQQLDDWPADGSLLFGATNHPELLDPAIWRRFEVTVDFPLPDASAREDAVRRFAGESLPAGTVGALGHLFSGLSFSEMETTIQRARRAAALGYGSLTDSVAEITASRVRQSNPSERREIAVALVEELGLSQRRVHELTGVSRDTIRKAIRHGSR